MVSAFKIVFKVILEVVGDYWWIIIPIVLFFIFKELWLYYIRVKFIGSLKWVLLEIKIPKEVQKTPKAMEQIFAGLLGIDKTPNFVEKWFKGKMNGWFSLEIIGKGGEIHFLIRTLEKYRNLVEAQVYAQYPDSEIAEVEDYVAALPSKIPSENYDAWGTELILAKDDAYPIRTYPYFFEEAKEEERIDPLASLSEILSNITPNEHIWIQVLVSPANEEWKEKGEKLVEKLIGRKVEFSKKGLILEEAHGWFEALKDGLYDLFSSPSKVEQDYRKPQERPLESLMLYLSPGQREVISAIENNIAKLGFNTLIRFVYWSRADAFIGSNKAAVIGAFKQFNTLNLNGFKPNNKTKTYINYFFKKRREFYRKVKILNNYKRRYFPHWRFFRRGFVLNIEELASIYHIPGKIVEAPTMPRIEAKKGSPPSGLPTE